MPPAAPDPDALVGSKFSVTGTLRLPDGGSEYEVACDGGSKKAFEELEAALSPLGLTPWLTGEGGACRLVVAKEERGRGRTSGAPTAAALLSLVSIAVFALLEGLVYEEDAQGVSFAQAAALYALSVVAVLAAREVGRMAAARRTGGAASTYLIPGIPTVTAFMPVVGASVVQRGPALNRDRLFDSMAAAPFAGLLASALLGLAGALTSASFAAPAQGGAAGGFVAAWQLGPSLLQRGMETLASTIARGSSAGTSASPMADAASAGLMLSFMGLFPLVGFEGGCLFASAFGSRAARAASYAGAALLVCLDTPRYWALAILVLMLAGRSQEMRLLDEVSGLSRSRRALAVLAVAVALLSLPVPGSLVALPLG